MKTSFLFLIALLAFTTSSWAQKVIRIYNNVGNGPTCVVEVLVHETSACTQSPLPGGSTPTTIPYGSYRDFSSSTSADGFIVEIMNLWGQGAVPAIYTDIGCGVQIDNSGLIFNCPFTVCPQPPLPCDPDTIVYGEVLSNPPNTPPLGIDYEVTIRY